VTCLIHDYMKLVRTQSGHANSGYHRRLTTRLLLTAATGWTLMALLAVTIRLPYRLRRPAVFGTPDGTRQGVAPGARRRLRWHFWLGYGIAGLALLHGWISMTRPIVGRAHHGGLRLAVLALLLALLEVGLGLWLRRRLDGGRRRLLRRIHFWAMATLVALVVVHVALDSFLLGTFRLS
jgi:hypothetical protein